MLRNLNCCSIGIFMLASFFGLAALGQDATLKEGPAAAGAYLIRIDTGGDQPILMLAVLNQDGTFQANAMRPLAAAELSLRTELLADGFFESRVQHLGAWKLSEQGQMTFNALNLSGGESASMRTRQPGAIIRTSGRLTVSQDGDLISGELFQRFFLDSENPLLPDAVPFAELGPFSFTGRRIPADEPLDLSIEARGQPKLDICHIDQETGDIIQISIADPAYDAHSAHGDFLVPTFFEDVDGDGVGNPAVSVTQCEAPDGFVPAENGQDCNDNASSCTSDCASDGDGDGRADCLDQCSDADGDGYGTDTSSSIVGSGSFSVGECTIDGAAACDIGPACLGEDCDDGNAAINPAATEVCDFDDNDCDGSIDEGFDQDSDTFTSCGGDCDDNDASVFPGADDSTCNGVDNDCDLSIDEDFVSTPTMCGLGECSAEGALVCSNGMVEDTCMPGPATPEICDDGLDNDCDGLTDDGDADDCPAGPTSVNDQFLNSCILLPVGGGTFSRTFTIPAPGVLANDTGAVSAVSANMNVLGGGPNPWDPPGPQPRTCTPDFLCTTDANFVVGSSSLTINADGGVDITYTTTANLLPGANVIAEFLYRAVDGNANQSDPALVEVFCTVQ